MRFSVPPVLVDTFLTPLTPALNTLAAALGLPPLLPPPHPDATSAMALAAIAACTRLRRLAIVRIIPAPSLGWITGRGRLVRTLLVPPGYCCSAGRGRRAARHRRG